MGRERACYPWRAPLSSRIGNSPSTTLRRGDAVTLGERLACAYWPLSKGVAPESERNVAGVALSLEQMNPAAREGPPGRGYHTGKKRRTPATPVAFSGVEPGVPLGSVSVSPGRSAVRGRSHFSFRRAQEPFQATSSWPRSSEPRGDDRGHRGHP